MSDALNAMMERIQKNAVHLTESYQSANQLLDTALMEAYPWVLSVPMVRNKVPGMFKGILSKSTPLTPDKLERLATQLIAILYATYGAKGGMPPTPPPEKPGKILNFKER